MGNHDNCVETIRSGGHYYLLNARDYPKGVTVLNEDDYADRLKKVKLSGDSRAMFDSFGQYEDFTEGELRAHAAYAIAGLLDHPLEDGQQVIAYENQRGLVPGDIPTE